MVRSKNMLNKAVFALLALSSFSVYCAEVAPAGAAQANKAGEDLILVSEAQDSLGDIPSVGVGDLVDQVNALRVQLQQFARDYMVSFNHANNSEVVKKALNTIANVDFAGLPLVQALKAALGLDNITLINFIADPNWSANPAEGVTPLMYAAYAGDVNKIKILLALGSNPNALDHNRFAALTFAEQENKEAAKQLLAPVTNNPDRQVR